MSEDKRKKPRIDLYVEVRIKHQGLHKVKDLSLSGLFIRLQDTSQFKQRDEIELIMKLPGEKDPMRLKARVARVITDGIGVEFVDLLPQEEMALEYCFNVFKHTLPLPGS
jgi:c-di-GMP-binding flagellar brake protein YcgR